VKSVQKCAKVCKSVSGRTCGSDPFRCQKILGLHAKRSAAVFALNAGLGGSAGSELAQIESKQ
jgi:hypothetical protein